MPGIPYPPNMPLYPDRILHDQHHEGRWANPVSFLDLYILVVLLFLLSLWGVTITLHDGTLLGLSPRVAIWIVSLAPPVALLIVLFLLPRMATPVGPYLAALFYDGDDTRLRWNFAVVSTAHIYCGHHAQAEWLTLMTRLSADDRVTALHYIRRVANRLQQFPPVERVDLMATLIAGALAFGVSVLFLQYDPLYAMLHTILVMVILELLMLAMLLQRWQHGRRLAELEDIFEELLPRDIPRKKPEPVEDDVQRWYREQLEAKMRAAAAPPPHADPQPPPPLWE